MLLRNLVPTFTPPNVGKVELFSSMLERGPSRRLDCKSFSSINSNAVMSSSITELSSKGISLSQKDLVHGDIQERSSSSGGVDDFETSLFGGALVYRRDSKTQQTGDIRAIEAGVIHKNVSAPRIESLFEAPNIKSPPSLAPEQKRKIRDASDQPAKRKNNNAGIPATASSPEDYADIDTVALNAGASPETLSILLDLCRSYGICSVAVAWDTRISKSFSNHCSSAEKYCTPSSSCFHWNCTCDKNLRVGQAFEPLLGLFVLFPESSCERLFFIPLSLTSSNPSSCPWLPSNSPASPIVCCVSLEERWDAVLTILQLPITKIMFHTQVALLPLIVTFTNLRKFKKDDDATNFNLKNLFDVKVAAHVLNSDLKAEELEFPSICSRLDIPLRRIQESDICRGGTVTEMIRNLKSELGALFDMYKLQGKQMVDIDAMISFANIEMPLIQVLSLMELRGVTVDLLAVNSIHQKACEAISELTTKAHNLAGQSFNLASPEQVAGILYSNLKIPAPSQSTSKQRHISTSEDDLRTIECHHEIISVILAYRSLKTVSAFIEGIHPFIRKDDSPIDTSSKTGNAFDILMASAENNDRVSRIHAQLNQTTTRTGRLSCCKPNMQSIAKDQVVSGININPRECFVPSSKGMLIVAADYSQIEIRVMAHMSGDRGLRDIFAIESDVYVNLAAKVFKKESSSITAAERNKAKTVSLFTFRKLLSLFSPPNIFIYVRFAWDLFMGWV